MWLQRASSPGQQQFLAVTALLLRTQWLLLLAALALPSAHAGAQGLSVPSASYGALTFPELESFWEFGLNFDRFTDSTKDIDYLDQTRRVPRYALRQTIGYNLAHLGRSWRWRKTGSVIRVLALGGWAGDQPTNFLQNQFRHHDDNLHYVPVDHPQHGVHGGLTLDINRWFDGTIQAGERTWLSSGIFLGAGGTASTIHNEVILQGGLRSFRWRLLGVDLPAPSAMFRKAMFVRRGRVPDSTLANTYMLTGLSVRVPVDRWLNATLLPEIELGRSSSTGLYLDDGLLRRDDSLGLVKFRDPLRKEQFRVRETFCTVALRWVGGDFTIETWNDTCGNKDIGPSYGARMYVRWRHWWWEN